MVYVSVTEDRSLYDHLKKKYVYFTICPWKVLGTVPVIRSRLRGREVTVAEVGL